MTERQTTDNQFVLCLNKFLYGLAITTKSEKQVNKSKKTVFFAPFGSFLMVDPASIKKVENTSLIKTENEPSYDY